MTKPHPVSAIILAAGNSSRMNFPKPFLPYDEERCFIEKIMDDYIGAGIGRILGVIGEEMERRMKLIISANYPDRDIRLMINRLPERGRFYSILLGLAQLKGSGGCFLQNSDNPFTSVGLLEGMIGEIDASSYVVPSFRGIDGHPVLLGHEVVVHLQGLQGHEHNLRNQLAFFKKIKVEWTDAGILANINTREDYKKYFLTVQTRCG